MHLIPMIWNCKWTTTANLRLACPLLLIPPLIRLCPRTQTMVSIVHPRIQDPTVPCHTSAHLQYLHSTPLFFPRSTSAHSPILAEGGLLLPTFPMSSTVTSDVRIIRRACLAPYHRHLHATIYLNHSPTRPASLVAPPDAFLPLFSTPARTIRQSVHPAPPAFLRRLQPRCIAPHSLDALPTLRPRPLVKETHPQQLPIQARRYHALLPRAFFLNPSTARSSIAIRATSRLTGSSTT